MTSFVVEEFDYSRASDLHRQQIREVYEYAFVNDIGLEFNAALDNDFNHPECYYFRDIGGAFFVVYQLDSEGTKSIVGTTGIRPLDANGIPPDCIFLGSGEAVCRRNGSVCELKRMFILPCARGKGYATQLMRVALDFAKALNYDVILLDTKFRLTSANALYEKVGFLDCSNYNHNPRADRFMGKSLLA